VKRRFGLLLLAALPLALWLYTTRAPLQRDRISEPAPAGAERGLPARPGPPQATAEPSGARESAPAEPEITAAPPEPGEAPDPPTPERPGPGQALLRVLAVARETGAPLGGLALGLRPADEEEEEREWDFSTQADPARGVEGDDVLTRPDGRAEFVVRAGYDYELYGGGWSGVAGEARLTPLALTEGEQREVRLAFPTAWLREWHGRVVEFESGRPRDGIGVVVLDAGADTLAEMAELARGTTRGDGRIALRVPEWRRLIVRLEAEGYVASGARLKDEEASSPESAQELALRRTATLAVHVLDSDGAPAAGIEVRVRVPVWGLIEGLIRLDDQVWRAVTAADGRCELPAVPSAADLFVTLARGERTLEWTSMEESFRLEPDERRELEVRLEAGIELGVRVRDGASRPLAEASFALFETSLSFAHPFWRETMLDRWIADSHLSGEKLANGTTDAEGRFVIAHVRPGSYWLAPIDEDLPEAFWYFAIPTGAARHALELTLDRGLLVQGRVIGPDGKGVGDASLWCRTPDGRRSLGEESRADGSFALGPLVAGTYLLGARGGSDPFLAPSAAIEAQAGGPPVTLAMGWGGRIRLAPVDEAGRALGQGTVRLFAGGREVASGDLEVAHVSPGVYDLVFWADEGRIGLRRGLAVRARDDLVVPLEVSPGAVLVFPARNEWGEVERVTLEWEGLDLGWVHGSQYAVGPGSTTVRCFRLGADGEPVLAGAHTRQLAAGEEWQVELPR